MAKIYPSSIDYVNAPYSEGEVYKALVNLSNDYVIFHSVQWIKKNFDKNFTWYENDFLILHKKYGILILEVKGGRIYFKDGIFHQVNTTTNEDVELDEGNDPLSQAKRGAYHFRKLLEKNIKGISNRLSIEPCIWLPSTDISNCKIMSAIYEDARNVILDSKSLSKSQEKIENVFKYYHADTITDITDDEFESIKNTIAPDFDLIPSPSVIKGEIDSRFLRLTKEQTGLLDYLEEQRTATIQGAAGTGKTIIALESAKRFAKMGKRVLFLCFNKFLFEHLKFDCPIKGVDFYNINTYVSTFSNLDLTNSKIRSKELLRMDVEDFKYDAVVIDEAQDFENDEIEFFATLCELKDAFFYLFFDKNQLVTTSEFPKWITNAECKLVLTKNCRNTYEIACTSLNVIDVPIKANIGTFKSIPPTFTFSHKNDINTLGKIIKYYKNDDNGYTDSEITILSLTSEEKSIMNNVKEIGGITISRKRNNKNVLFTTAKKFKGLENKVIIIIDINESCFNDDAQKRVFYVACSRATHRLSLYLCGSTEEIEKIGKSIEGLNFSAKGNLLSKTRTTPLSIN